ncbi:MAG TPA: PASTA domain-containing protein [Flavobacteriales bacterium]|nr:PASTA domain-containing protein [Flavobacteriales bacterium]
MEQDKQGKNGFFTLFKNKVFYKQLAYAVFAMLLCFFLWLKYIDFYTLHDEYIVLPDFYGVHINDLDSVCQELDLRYVIIDSVFNKKVEKGTILEQDPIVGTKVKENRRVYFTINALQNKIVTFPYITDLSLRQAVRKLENLGLVVGNLEYKPDLARNVVLSQKVNGIKIKAGQELFVGTAVDLVIGSGLSDKTTTIPNLMGLTMQKAQTEIKVASLNLGAVIFNEGISDSSAAMVYRQNPKVNEKRKVKLGTSIDIYLQ